MYLYGESMEYCFSPATLASSQFKKQAKFIGCSKLTMKVSVYIVVANVWSSDGLTLHNYEQYEADADNGGREDI